MVANRVEAPTLTVPAATPITAPVSALLYEQRAALDRIQVKIPPGPSGLVGFALWHSSEQIIPKIGGTWIVGDNEVIEWVLDDLPPWPDWHIKAYNLDVYPHTLYLRLELDDRVPTPAQTLTLVPIE